jgi:hypothetical protein
VGHFIHLPLYDAVYCSSCGAIYCELDLILYEDAWHDAPIRKWGRGERIVTCEQCDGTGINWVKRGASKPINPLQEENTALREENRALRALVTKLDALAMDLRAYTHDWDWKYGEEWDSEMKSIAEEVKKLIAKGAKE